MKIYKLNLSLRECMDKEYIVTNGMGGYASSTICSMNTRRYHGLLVAKTKNNPRKVLLSKIDESIIIGEEEHILYSNMSDNYISDGFDNLVSVEYNYYPKMTYEVEGVTITKEIVMKHLANTTIIKYTVKTNNEKAKLKLTPIITNRNFHYLKDVRSEAILKNNNAQDKENENENIITKNNYTKVSYDYNDDTRLNIYVSDSSYSSFNNNYFDNMFYIREEERGFDHSENLLVPGKYEIEIPKNVTKEIYVVCDLAENEKVEETEVSKEEYEKELLKNISKSFSEETKRIEDLVKEADIEYIYEEEILLSRNKNDIKELEEFKHSIIASADQFVIKKEELNSVIAGYHWFADWGRDTLIAFEGLLLKTKRYEEAKNVLLYLTKDISNGLVPNGYDEKNIPYYNSADASLLLFEAIAKYLEYTNDYNFVLDNFYDKLKDIIENYEKGITFFENNIYLDKDYLLVSGSPNIQNTWMDSKVEGYPVTPRNGKAVEINALWYNALKIMQTLSEKTKDHNMQVKLNDMAIKCKESFKKEFVSKKGGLKDTAESDSIRPNQMFAISLTHKIIDDVLIAESILDIVTKKLLNRYGLKTLAKGEEHYTDKYFGDSKKRDFSYHNGITWPWLLLPYYNGLKYVKELTGKKEYEKQEEDFIKKTYDTFLKNMYQRPCVNGISELADSVFPYDPNGTITQAWSVAAIITILFK